MRYTCVFLILCFLPAASFAESASVDPHTRSRAHSLFLAGKQHQPRFSLVGELKKGSTTPYSVNGVDFSISSDALITAKLQTGQQVKVRGIVADGKKIAKKVLGSEKSFIPRVEENKEALF